MIDTGYYAKTLGDERVRLETELASLGKHETTNPQNWDVAAPAIDIMQADENEAADRAEELHIDSIVLDELEIRYRHVLHALKKIEQGAYGICEVGGEPIEEERLRANAAARTCKAHMGKEEQLPL